MIPVPALHNLWLLPDVSARALKKNPVYIWGLIRQLVIFTFLFLSLWKKQEAVYSGMADCCHGWKAARLKKGVTGQGLTTDINIFKGRDLFCFYLLRNVITPIGGKQEFLQTAVSSYKAIPSGRIFGQFCASHRDKFKKKSNSCCLNWGEMGKST